MNEIKEIREKHHEKHTSSFLYRDEWIKEKSDGKLFCSHCGAIAPETGFVGLCSANIIQVITQAPAIGKFLTFILCFI